MRRRRGRRALPLVAGAALLLAAVLVLGAGDQDLTSGDLQVLSDSLDVGCPTVVPVDPDGAGFALDGRVTSVRAGAGEASVLGLDVLTWYRGPPLDQVDVEVGALPGTGQLPAPGDRLLVQARWEQDGAPPRVLSCGARVFDAVLAEAWAAAWADATDGSATSASTVEPPVARYPSTGFRRLGPVGGPVLTGVLVREGDCLYVADGLHRWLPVFPASHVEWDEAAQSVDLSGFRLDVGRAVRLGGAPENGELPRRGEPVTPGEGTGRSVPQETLPPGCDHDTARFVVAEPRRDDTMLTVVPLPQDAATVVAVRRAAEEAGLRPVDVEGTLEIDEFGGQAFRHQVSTSASLLGQEVDVLVGTVPGPAWPDAFDTADATVLSSADGPVRGLLPTGLGVDGELVSVEREGRTQVMIRDPVGVVVTVTADVDATDDQVATMARLAASASP